MRGRRAVCAWALLAGFLAIGANAAAEDRQLRPFAGVTFGGSTTFVDPEAAVGHPNPAIGVDAVFLGEVFGVDVDVADAPGFFQSGDKHLVIRSHVTTITGNVIVAAPHRLTEYSFRPYLVAGGGLMRVGTTTSLSVFDVSTVTPVFDAGAGVVAFLTNRIGVSWEVRRFQSAGRSAGDTGLSFGGESLSFWRGTMAAVIRY